MTAFPRPTPRRDDRDAVPPIDHLDDLVEVAADGVFLRFSRGPAADRQQSSMDHESGLELPGLSVVPLAAPRWWTRPFEDWLARQACKYLHLREETADDRYGWVLRGRVVGRGPDDEPLVAEVEPLGWLTDDVLEQARRRYRERFDVGEDST